MKKRNFYIIIVALFSIIILSGCKNSKENIEFEKSLSEISFLENQCITIFNKVVAEEYIKDNQVDWNLLKEDYVVLYNSIDVIMIDLASIQIPSQSIVEFENRFSDLNVCVENQDLNMFALKICDTYNFITNSISSSIYKNEALKQEKRAKAKEEAQKAISEDGYWGVSQTSDRIIEMAKALTGGDPDKIEDMRKAFETGFKEATKTWGRDLPEISSNTYDAVMEKFDKWAEESAVI